MNIGIFCLIIIDILIVILFCVLISKIGEWKRELEKKDIKPIQRVHTKVKTSNYNNSYGNRAYDKYKNKDGLYEPQKPHQGIELKSNKED